MTITTNIMEWEYNGVKIKLDETSKRFSVIFGEGDEHSFASWREATEAVDERRKREQQLARIKINVPVVRLEHDGKMIPHAITGIHAGNGTYLATPPIHSRDYGTLYLDHPAVLAILKELAAAQAVVMRCRKLAEPFELSTLNNRPKTLEAIEAWQKDAIAKAEGLK